MLKKLIIVPAVCMLMLVGCNSNEGKIGLGKNQKTDNTFIMRKNKGNDDKAVSDIYAKFQGKEKTKLASDVPLYNQLEYLEGEKSILVQNDENSLVKHNSEGEKETIGKDLLEPYGEGISYKVSGDNQTVVYMTDDEELYIKQKDKDKDKISSKAWYYDMDSTGKYVYYIDDENDLNVYIDGNSEKISSDVNSFRISGNGEDVVFLNTEENLYIKNINKEEKEKISSGSADISSVRIYPDGVVTYLNDYDYEDSKGELYIYDGEDKDKVASDVSKYVKKGDKFYFINDDSTLYEKELKKDESEKIQSDVKYVRLMNDSILYVNEDGNIYTKKDGKEAEKVGKNINSNGSVDIINGEKILYLTENNDLFLGDDKIAEEVLGYACNSEIVAYVASNKEVHSYNLKNKKDQVEIKNAKEFSEIYLEDRHLYSNILEPSDLTGFWEVKSYGGEFSIIIEFSGKNKITFYNPEVEPVSQTYKVSDSSVDYLSLEVGDEGYIGITRKDDKNLELYCDGEEEYATKISKEEADKILKDGKKQIQEVKNQEVNESIKTLIDDYEYAFVEAVNQGNSSLIHPYVVYNGKLYNEHEKNIYDFYDRGISETLYEARVDNIEKVNDREYRVKVYEKVGVIKEGSEKIKEFNTTYIVIEENGEFLIREML